MLERLCKCVRGGDPGFKSRTLGGVGVGGVGGGSRQNSLSSDALLGFSLACRLRKDLIVESGWRGGKEVCCLHALFGISHSCRTITPFAPEMLRVRPVFSLSLSLSARRTSAKDGPAPLGPALSTHDFCTHTQTRTRVKNAKCARRGAQVSGPPHWIHRQDLQPFGHGANKQPHFFFFAAASALSPPRHWEGLRALTPSGYIFFPSTEHGTDEHGKSDVDARVRLTQTSDTHTHGLTNLLSGLR